MKPAQICQAWSCLLTIILLASSCKKDIKDDNLVPPIENKKPVYTAEQAYPGLHGEFFKAKFNGNEIYVEKKADRYIWMNDIAFDEATFNSLKQEDGTSERTYKPTISKHWPNGEVFYSIQSGFTTGELTFINDAINHWRNNTSLKFTSVTSNPNLIRISRGGSGSGNFSDYIGMKGGNQLINLEANSFDAGTVIHEIGHTIGFYHEQCRADRDNFIDVNTDNVVPHTSNNIYQYQTYIARGEEGAQLGTLDFQSIMLYPSFAFSDGIHPVMTLAGSNTPFFPQHTSLSAGDIETAAFIYGPPIGRLVYHQTSLMEQYGDLNEWVREEGGYTVEFYSDAACTVPLTLSQSRTIFYYTYCSCYTGLILNSLTLSPGSQIYDLPVSYYYEYRSEYGNTVSYTSSGALAAGGAWR